MTEEHKIQITRIATFLEGIQPQYNISEEKGMSIIKAEGLNKWGEQLNQIVKEELELN